MKRVMIYSHDTYGLSNNRRILSICQALTDFDPNLSILLITGSPMIQSFRIPQGIDYVKLPCLTKSQHEVYTPRILDEETKQVMRLRSEMILCTTANFVPDLMIVDNNPVGVQYEFESTLAYTRECLPKTKFILLLGDILDSARAIKNALEQECYYDVVRQYFEMILALGWPEGLPPTRNRTPLQRARKK